MKPVPGEEAIGTEQQEEDKKKIIETTLKQCSVPMVVANVNGTCNVDSLMFTLCYNNCIFKAVESHVFAKLEELKSNPADVNKIKNILLKLQTYNRILKNTNVHAKQKCPRINLEADISSINNEVFQPLVEKHISRYNGTLRSALLLRSFMIEFKIPVYQVAPFKDDEPFYSFEKMPRVYQYLTVDFSMQIDCEYQMFDIHKPSLKCLIFQEKPTLKQFINFCEYMETCSYYVRAFYFAQCGHAMSMVSCTNVPCNYRNTRWFFADGQGGHMYAQGMFNPMVHSVLDPEFSVNFKFGGCSLWTKDWPFLTLVLFVHKNFEQTEENSPRPSRDGSELIAKLLYATGR